MAASTYTPVTVEGTSAVVIGGTSGIGRAIAEGFAADGADVVATSRDNDRVADTAASLRSLGSETATITSDVTDPESIRQLRDEAVETLGSVDVLVNSVGLLSAAPIAEMDDDEWDHTLDVLLDGVFRSCRSFADVINTGSIVIVSSINARLAREHAAAYCAAKGGVESFTRVAAAEFGPEIRVNAIAPGVFLTPMTESSHAPGSEPRRMVEERALAGRIGNPEEAVGAAIYLASEAASYTTGTVLTVDGGLSIAR